MFWKIKKYWICGLLDLWLGLEICFWLGPMRDLESDLDSEVMTRTRTLRWWLGIGFDNLDSDTALIDILPYQTPGISNQALVLMIDVKIFAKRTDIVAKSAIFDHIPAGKWFSSRICVPWNFLKNLISTIWDSFSGGASPSYDPFLQCNGRTKC